jgi:hypothetical protein
MKTNAPLFDGTLKTGAFDRQPVTDDVRHQIRYPLRAPVAFTWFTNDGKIREAKGNSRNIGESGAYVVTRNCPPVGAQIIMVFRFRKLTDFAHAHHLEMSGRVVRTESLANSKGTWGFAVASSWTVLQAAEGPED